MNLQVEVDIQKKMFRLKFSRKCIFSRRFTRWYSCTKNHQLPPKFTKTDNVTVKWPRAEGATMLVAKNLQFSLSKWNFWLKMTPIY